MFTLRQRSISLTNPGYLFIFPAKIQTFMRVNSFCCSLLAEDETVLIVVCAFRGVRLGWQLSDLAAWRHQQRQQRQLWQLWQTRRRFSLFCNPSDCSPVWASTSVRATNASFLRYAACFLFEFPECFCYLRIRGSEWWNNSCKTVQFLSCSHSKLPQLG